jgi:hypothetical protein
VDVQLAEQPADRDLCWRRHLALLLEEQHLVLEKRAAHFAIGFFTEAIGERNAANLRT